MREATTNNVTSFLFTKNKQRIIASTRAHKHTERENNPKSIHSSLTEELFHETLTGPAAERNSQHK